MNQTVLIADGDNELRDLYELFLTEQGYDVETASAVRSGIPLPLPRSHARVQRPSSDGVFRSIVDSLGA